MPTYKPTMVNDAIRKQLPKEKINPIALTVEQIRNMSILGSLNQPQQRIQTLQQQPTLESKQLKQIAKDKIVTKERLDKFAEQERIDKERELKVAPYAAMGLVGTLTGTLPLVIGGEIGGRSVDYASEKLTGKSFGENVLPEAPAIGSLFNPGYIVGGLAGQFRNQIGSFAAEQSKIALSNATKISNELGYAAKHQYYTKAPWTYKPNPNNYYRAGRGSEFLDDVINTNQVRAVSGSPAKFEVNGERFNVQKHFPEKDTYWSKGVPLDGKYSSKNQNYGNHIIEASNDIPFVRSVNQRLKEKGFWDKPFKNYNDTHLQQQYVRPRDSYFTELDEFGKPITGTGKPLPYDTEKIKLLKPHWFKGYKEITNNK